MEWIVSILSSSILTNILLLLLLIACWRIWSATNQIEYDAYYIANICSKNLISLIVMKLLMWEGGEQWIKQLN